MLSLDMTNMCKFYALADSPADQTFTISPEWDIDKNDVQQLVHLSEEKNSLFRYR